MMGGGGVEEGGAEQDPCMETFEQTTSRQASGSIGWTGPKILSPGSPTLLKSCFLVYLGGATYSQT